MALKPDTEEFSQFLRLAFLRSPNYAAGSAGWTINQDGSAEFNNVTIRGAEVIGGAALFYSTSPPTFGSMIASIAGFPGGTDAKGNVYLPGVTAYFPGGPPAGAVQLFDGTVTFYSAGTEAGPWRQLGQIQNGEWAQPTGGPGITLQTGTHNQVSIQDTLVAIALILEANAGLAVTGGTTTDTLDVTGASTLTGAVGVGALLSALAGLSVTGGTTTDTLSVSGASTLTGAVGVHALLSALAGLAVTGGTTTDTLDVTGASTLTGAVGVGALLSALAGLSVTGGATVDSLDVAAALSNLNALTVSNSISNGGKALVQLITALATDRALGIQVNGDTSERFRFDMATSSINFGSGAATTDTTLYRGGAGQLASSPIAANVAGAAEVWNTPTFANSWTAPGTPTCRYRLIAAPYNSMQWIGRLKVPTGFTGLQAITTALAARYRPTNAQDILAFDQTPSPPVPVWLSMATTGVLTFVGPTTGVAVGDTITIPGANGVVSLDA